MKRCDVAIIGGGPAGSTVACLLNKYAPHLKIEILEQSHFPRHHVGESLLAGGTPVLKEMGVYEKIDAAGFVEKFGASFVWGKPEATWHFDFSQICQQLESGGIVLPKEYFKGWQVTRAEYDKILLDHAKDCGVRVHEGARVADVRVEDAANRGITYVENGQAHELNCELVVDASGQGSVVARSLHLQEFDEQLRNVAIFGYWKGAKWKYEYVGNPQLTRILVASTPQGWLWYIPVRKDTISVGFVTHASLTNGLGDLQEQYFRQVRSSPEVADLLEPAQLLRISEDQPSDLVTVRDWSYTSRRMTGKGWISVGDAAGFVDPILSSGVMLAHVNGQKAAYTINSVFNSGDPARQAEYWQFYESTYREILKAYREMARFWYANNYSTDGWWWQAWRAIAQGGDMNLLTNRDAFVRLASGYANRLESVHLFGSYTLDEAMQLVDVFFGGNNSSNSQPGLLPDLHKEAVLRLGDHAQFASGFLFFGGSIRDTRRLCNTSNGRFLDLYPSEVSLVERLNGGCSAGDFLSQRTRIRKPDQLLCQLIEMGVVVDEANRVLNVRQSPQTADPDSTVAAVA